ncbi:MAG: PqqD family protein [Rhizomicrobium sp.]|nr:PqqD family protein [Rhizomicrobium sp.]
MSEKSIMLHRQGEWLTQQIGDELLMLNAEQGKYVSLSPIALRIWEMIQTPMRVETIYAQFVEAFDVTPEICRSDVDAFVAQMIQNGLAAFTDV